MVEVIKDTDGKVVAYAEISPRDLDGKFCEVGTCLYVHELWVHESMRFKKVWKQLLDNVLCQLPYIQWIYWNRHKYGDRMTTISLEQLRRR